MMEARTNSIEPAWMATSVMINSAALPRLALSRPPICGPVFLGQCLGRFAQHARRSG